MSEWIEIAGKVWDGNSYEGREAWLESAGHKDQKDLATFEWALLPFYIQNDLTAEYEEEERMNNREGYQEVNCD